MERTLLSLAVSLTFFACVGPFSEEFESHYADVRAARSDGAFDRGWLPEIVPDEAIEIWEFHSIDTNLTWACFTTPEGPEGARALLEERGAQRTAGPIHDGPGGLLGFRDWWPGSMADADVEAYRLTEDAGFALLVGVDVSLRKVCFYRS